METGSEQYGPRVSVVMPAYNAEAYIEAAIESVLRQTVEDWELIVLDDCSTDKTAEIIEKYSARDCRISPVYFKENAGVAKVRNHALDICKGKYIALIDSDDVWKYNKLERQLSLAEKTGADIIYCSYKLSDDQCRQKSRDFIVPEATDYEAMLKKNVIGCSTVMLKRQALDRRRFSAEIYHEDYALWLELLRSGCTAAGCTEVLVDWRVVHTGRSFNKLSAAKNRWIIYRKAEKLSLLKSLRVFAAYTLNGIVKHKRL